MVVRLFANIKESWLLKINNKFIIYLTKYHNTIKIYFFYLNKALYISFKYKTFRHINNYTILNKRTPVTLLILQ